MSTTGNRSRQLLIGERINATYRKSLEPLHQHNCFIEALPEALTPEKVTKLIARYPFYDERERSLPDLQRLAAVQRISSCIFPMPEFLEFEQKFSRMIRNGYLGRNPEDGEWIRQMRAGFPDLDFDQDGLGFKPLIRSTAAGFTVVGTSGVGKSTIVESILGLNPQIIVHTEYNGKPFDQQQLVWLKLECPFDGSLKGLCLSFFAAVDEILGTRHSAQYANSRRWTAIELLPAMAKLAATLGLGVLVIDEIQRLSKAASGGAQMMLKFFIQLTNTFGVPVVLIGTYEALALFTGNFAMARRAAGQGDVIISNLKHDEYWTHFLNKLWRYQWTKEPTPLTPPLNRAMYNESQGIVDIAVKLYMLAQWSIIGEESELLTPKIIKDVALKNFNAARPILQALRYNDTEALSRITDIAPKFNQLEQFLAQAGQAGHSFRNAEHPC